ncbi:hypothetical protein CWI39_0785p0010 [Hamiltosporidium magnivora]|nr:hypothetical protein CWI39_0785p0010 [Hamiltosporidium magnivora]
MSLNDYKDFISFVKDIYSRLSDDVFNYENKANMLVCDTLTPVYASEKLLSLDLYTQTSSIEKFRNIKLPLRTYVRCVMRSRYKAFDFNILNLYELKNLKVHFYQLYLKIKAPLLKKHATI